LLAINITGQEFLPTTFHHFSSAVNRYIVYDRSPGHKCFFCYIGKHRIYRYWTEMPARALTAGIRRERSSSFVIFAASRPRRTRPNINKISTLLYHVKGSSMDVF